VHKMFKYQISVNLFSDKNINELKESLNNIGENRQIFGNTWLTKSDLRPNQIQNIFSNALNKKDYYTVIEINNTTGSIVVLPQETLDWFLN